MTSKQAIRIWIVRAVIAVGFAAVANAADAPAPTFTKKVAPILFKHCINCHRPGESAADISFMSYGSAKGWAASIREKVLRREMPPWPADPARSLKFRNDARLSQQEIDTLVAWVNAGAPKGNDADLPAPPSLPQGWLHPKGLKPDIVISLPEFQLPAQRELPYFRYLAKVPFLENKWIVAMQVLPGNRSVVHHMAITEVALADGVTPANMEELDEAARKLGFPNGLNSTTLAVAPPGNSRVHDMLGVYTPGTAFEIYDEGTAKLLKGGTNLYLNFNIHYQTTGQAEKDQSKLALWFRPEAPQHQLFRVSASGETIIAAGKQLLADAPGEKAEGTNVVIPPIPPHAEDYEVISVTAYTEPVTIYQFQPHAHLRGKDFNYAVIYPDGREENLLSVPKYDFHWQLAYDLDAPLKLPAGSKLIVTAHYDNSPKNAHLSQHQGHHNSDSEHKTGSEEEVHFREKNQSWDEMFAPFIQYTIDVPDRSDELSIAEAVGCLEQGPSNSWMLTHASDPAVSRMQGTSSAALNEAGDRPLGSQRDELLGADVFNPSSQKGRKVAVKGVLIPVGKENRLNVTSLQTVAATCF